MRGQKIVDERHEGARTEIAKSCGLNQVRKEQPESWRNSVFRVWAGWR